MFMMKSLLAALSLTAGVLAAGKDDEGDGAIIHEGEDIQYRIYCETTDGSPLQHHVFEIADKVAEMDVDDCNQVNPAKSHCSGLDKNDGAIISICGPDEEEYEIDCPEVADMTRMLADECIEDNDRAGGYVYREEVSFSGYDRWPAAWIEVTRNEG